MRFSITILVLLLTPMSWGQTTDPRKTGLDYWGREYAPIFRPFDAQTDHIGYSISETNSPFARRSIHLIEESDLSITPYSESFLKAVIFELDNPVVTIEINKYRNYEFVWINEDVIHIFTSPGRCVRIDAVYDVSAGELLYEAGFNFCGV